MRSLQRPLPVALRGAASGLIAKSSITSVIRIHTLHPLNPINNLQYLSRHFTRKILPPDPDNNMGYTVPTDMTSRHVAVIGSGTLGRHVGLVWATKGGSVIIVDSKSEAASAAFAWIKKELPSQVKAVHGTSGQVVKETDIEKTVKGASMVVECIPEIKEAKIELLSQLDRFCDEDTIIATISSSYNSGDLLGCALCTHGRRGTTNRLQH